MSNLVKEGGMTFIFYIWTVVLLSIASSTLTMVFATFFSTRISYLVVVIVNCLQLFLCRYINLVDKYRSIFCDISLIESCFRLLMETVFKDDNTIYYYNPKGIGYAHEIYGKSWLLQFDYGKTEKFISLRIEVLILQTLTHILLSFVIMKFRDSRVR